jgi:lipase
MTYRTHDIPVDGGSLRVGEWGPDKAGDSDPSAIPTVVAVHGITASHLSWAVVAQALHQAGESGQSAQSGESPEIRLIAPDLRGRGRSAGLPGPYGMAQHAADLAAVTEALEVPQAVLVGHSMGAFVALVATHLYPDRFSDLLLVDGGLPLAMPPGISREDLLAATLGPAMSRLSMTFPDRATYLEFWKAHPAFAGDQWSEAVADYAAYDLTGTEPDLRPSTALEAVRQDSMDLYGGGVVMEALEALQALETVPEPATARGETAAAVDLPPDPSKRRRNVSLLTAPRGLLNEVPGLYSPEALGGWTARLPAVTMQEVPDVNHYTIVMGASGASAVAGELLRVVAGASHPSAGVPASSG